MLCMGTRPQNIGKRQRDCRGWNWCTSSSYAFVKIPAHLNIRSGVISNPKASQLLKSLLNSNLRACSGCASNLTQTPIPMFPTARHLSILSQTDAPQLPPHRASAYEAAALMTMTNSIFPVFLMKGQRHTYNKFITYHVLDHSIICTRTLGL